jgi:hypothetical protein
MPTQLDPLHEDSSAPSDNALDAIRNLIRYNHLVNTTVPCSGKPSTDGRLVTRMKQRWQLSPHHFAMTAFTSVQQ